MCQAICRYTGANNKYMNNHDRNKESSYLVYLDADNLYRYAMSKKLPIRNFNDKIKMTYQNLMMY